CKADSENKPVIAAMKIAAPPEIKPALDLLIQFRLALDAGVPICRLRGWLFVEVGNLIRADHAAVILARTLVLPSETFRRFGSQSSFVGRALVEISDGVARKQVGTEP